MEQRSFSQAVERRPAKRSYGKLKDCLWVVLCFVVPPLGLLVLWGNRSFNGAVRAVVTAASVAVMTVFLCRVFPVVNVQPTTVMPQTHLPEAAQEASLSDVLNALTNFSNQLERKQKVEVSDEPIDPAAASAEAMQLEAEKQALLNTIVYSVYGNKARYYHAVQQCGDQFNRRQMTLAEALAARMGACPDCDAPIYNYLSTEMVLDN